MLQSGEFIRVGSSKVLKTDVRVVAATNVNLIHAVSKGKFREDLYYRLNAVSITMPSLRERPGDINLLFRKFVSDFSAKYGVGRVALTEDASIMLRKYRWPGNIRQLKNVAETVAVLESARVPSQAEKCMVDAEALSRYIPKEDPNLLPVKSSSWQEENSGEREAIIRSIIQLKQDVDYLKDVVAKAGLSVQTPAAHVISAPVIQENTIAAVNHSNWGMPQENVEDPEEQELDAPANEDLSVESNCNDLIEKALHKHGGNRKAAAAELGISERTLYRKIKKLSE